MLHKGVPHVRAKVYLSEEAPQISPITTLPNIAGISIVLYHIIGEAPINRPREYYRIKRTIYLKLFFG